MVNPGERITGVILLLTRHLHLLYEERKNKDVSLIFLVTDCMTKIDSCMQTENTLTILA